MSLIQSRISSQLKGDKAIWLIVGLLALTSIVAVYSSTASLANRAETTATTFLIKHIILLFGGLVLMYVSHRVNYMRYARLSTLLLLGSSVLLVYTLLFGVVIHDATRWVRIPIVGITFQTSDFAKIALIMYSARTLSLMHQSQTQDGKKQVGTRWDLIVPILMICALIAPADLSSSLILFFTCLLLMFIGKAHPRNVISLFMLGVAVFAIILVLADFFPSIRVDTWQVRLRDFMLNGGSGEELTQVTQAKMAIASGGIVGKGPGVSIQAGHLPNAYSDYIYCIIIEEYGIIGGIFMIALYIALLLRCVRLVTRSPKAFGAILALGLSMSLVIQAFAHMAVNVDLMPVTGLTLPMVSMGGTSLMFTSFSIGVILSVSRYIESAN